MKILNSFKKDKKSLIILMLVIYSLALVVAYDSFLEEKKRFSNSNEYSESNIEELSLKFIACSTFGKKEWLKQQIEESKEELTDRNLSLASISGNANLAIAMIELGAKADADYIIRLITLKSMMSLTNLREIVDYLVLEKNFKLIPEEKQRVNSAILKSSLTASDISYLKEKLQLESDSERITEIEEIRKTHKEIITNYIKSTSPTMFERYFSFVQRTQEINKSLNQKMKEVFNG